ncbi:YadA-like family protein [Atlantibacter subterranea]|uniref:YadA-like family protein n=1 Tax=Atlantibacter subterraneus TaxID=255519 RepID=UPI0020C420C9|nr:YadA-like family protein [Atlantibacter subterranea]UTJ49482.1 YadA-like family protein [Atlantibacter subterranea]
MAAGTADTDAVNVAQLRGLEETPLTFAGNTGSVAKTLGSTVTIKGGKATAGTYSDKNMNTVVDASGNLNIQMADNPEFVSVLATNGTGSTKMSATGLTVTGGPSVTTTGINAGSMKITGVAAGTISSTSTDAINGSQLNAVATNPLSFAGNTGSVAKTLGSTVTIKGGKATAGTYSDKNMNTVVDASGNLNIQMADNPEFVSVLATNGTGSTKMSATGLTVTGGPSVTTSGINAGSMKITGVAAGTISSTSTDAINGSQLNAVATNPLSFAGNTGSVAKTLGSTMTIKGGKATAGTYSDKNMNTVVDASGNLNIQMADNPEFVSVLATNGTGSTKMSATGLTVTGGPSVTTSGINAGSMKITGVAAGTISSTSTDAINGSQLKKETEAVKTHYYSVNDGGVARANYDNDGAYGVNAVAAGVGAVANGSASVAMGYQAKTNGTNAVAIGANTLSNYNGTAIGNNAQARGNDSTALGSNSFAYADSSLAMGNDALTYGANSIAMGTNAFAMNNDDVALGSNSVTERAQATTGVTINDTHYDFAGINPFSTVSVGSRGLERTITNVAAGRITASSTDAINGSQLYATNSAIKDINDDVDGLNDRTLKYDWTDTNGDGLVQPGEVNYGKATLAGTTSTDGGVTGGTKITNLAQGDVSELSTDAINGAQLYAIAGDTTNEYTDNHGHGVRYVRTNDTGLPESDAFADGQGSSALGYNAIASGTSSLALGRYSRAYHDGDVALGSGAVTEAAVGTSGVTINDLNYRFAGVNPTSTVSVGSRGSERTITNVAAGRLSNTSTDAVNGSQLYATNSAIENLNDDVSGLDDRTLKYDWNDANGDGLVQPGEVNYGKATLAGTTSTDGGVTGGTKITNLAQGDVSELSTDAINGAQLYAIAGDTTNEYTDNHGHGVRYVRTNDTGLPESDAFADGQGSSALGYNAIASGTSSLALGRYSRAYHDGDVALGSGAVTEAAVGTSGVTINDLSYHFAGIDPLSTVSVGSRGAERTITNVAAGRITAESTDAINGSQLFATNQAINVLDKGSVKYDVNDDGTVNYNNITLGGDTYNSDTKQGGTTITNVAYGVDPSDAVNVQQLTDATTNIYNNGTKYFHATSEKADSVATGMDSIAVGPNAQSLGNGSIAMGDEAKSTGAGSAAIGQGAQTLGDNSVAMGTGAIANNANDVALGAGSVTQAAVATTSVTINGDTYAVAGNNPTSTVSVGSEGNERTITNVAAGRITADSTDAVNGSELYATNQSIEKISGDVYNLDQGSVKYETNVDGSVNYNKVIMGGDTYDNSTHTGGTTITNVANGVDPSDAVNKYQLDQVDQHVTNISNGTDGMFQVNNTSDLPKPTPTGKDSTAGGAGAIASGDYSTSIGANSKSTHNNSVALGYNSVTDRDNSVSMGSAGHERQVTNVAAGTADTDAANVGQLKQGVNNSYQYTNKKFNDLKNMVDDQKDKLSAGIAGAMATAGLPQPYQPGASMVGLAGGTYQGESAIALGVSTISDNGKWVTKIAGTTNSQGDVGAAVGVGYQF